MISRRLFRTKLTHTVLLVFIPLLWLGLVASLGLQEYFSLLDRAQNATTHIQALQQTLKTFSQTGLGENANLDSDLNAVRNQLDDTGNDLDYIRNELNRFHSLVEIAKVVTPFRADLEAVEGLVQSGHDFVKAGDRALDTGKIALQSFNNLSSISLVGLGDTTTTSDPNKINSAEGSLIDPVKLQEIQSGLQDVNQLVQQGVKDFNTIPYGQLKPGSTVARVVDQLRNQIPNLSTALDEGNKGFAAAQRLLGFDEPANYLVLLNDADELRPTGGFSGNYMLVTVWQGKLVSLLVDNTYKLDDPYLANAPLIAPQPYFDWWAERYNWGLRDVSLTPDWPDTAQWAQKLLLQEGGGGSLTGVIALNPGFIKDLLDTTGPVKVVSLPEYNETIDSNNFIERIHYHQDLDQQNDNISFYQRKRFTRYLAQAIVEKMKLLPKTKLTEIGKDAVTALNQKDLMLYMSDPTAEKLVDTLGWSGRVGNGKFEADSGSTTSPDYLYIVDTNMGGNKTNGIGVLKQTITDTISLNSDGSASHQTAINYDYYGKLKVYQTYTPDVNHVAYNRFYIPPGSRIIAREGFDSASGAVQQYGRDVWGQLLSVKPGQSRIVNFDWQTPALYGVHTVGGGGSYDLVVQRQAGAIFNYHIVAKPPEGMQITGVTGVANAVTNSDGSVTLFDGVLTSDMHFHLTLQKSSH